MKWRRRPFGYLSDDGQWFLERGGRMTHGCNAWLIWRRARPGDLIDYGYGPVSIRSNGYARMLAELSGEGTDETLFVDTQTEGGWLSEAKGMVGRRAS